jgi:hypothetical protein
LPPPSNVRIRGRAFSVGSVARSPWLARRRRIDHSWADSALAMAKLYRFNTLVARTLSRWPDRVKPEATRGARRSFAASTPVGAGMPCPDQIAPQNVGAHRLPDACPRGADVELD